jgi:serine protease Do
VLVDPPGETLSDQLDLPAGKGLVVREVVAGSAAAKVGLKPHDILLEIDGKAVPRDVRAFIQLLREVKAGSPVDVVVLRKGKQETLKGLALSRPAVPGAGS